MKVEKKICSYIDERGKIIDILKENIEHVTFISSKQGAVRGNHYHMKTLQWVYVLKGRLKVISQIPGEKKKEEEVTAGNLVFHAPMERHVLVALEDTEMLALTRGPRRGKSYETDTYRLEGEESLIEDWKWRK